MNIVTRDRAVPLRRIVTLTVLGLVSALALTLAPSAHAQTQSQAICPLNRICLYDDTNYRGAMAYYAVGSSHMGLYGPRFDNRTSSIRNNSPYRWCVYTNPYYGGAALIVSPRQSFASLGGWNNIISSLRRC